LSTVLTHRLLIVSLIAATLMTTAAVAAPNRAVTTTTATAKGKVFWLEPAPAGATAGDKLLYKPGKLVIGEYTWMTKLHWRHWGSPKATATGKGSTNTCKPTCADINYASGKARITLTRIRTVDGHREYMCLRGTIADQRVEWGCATASLAGTCHLDEYTPISYTHTTCKAAKRVARAASRTKLPARISGYWCRDAHVMAAGGEDVCTRGRSTIRIYHE
jgi:hypothetical protein